MCWYDFDLNFVFCSDLFFELYGISKLNYGLMFRSFGIVCFVICFTKLCGWLLECNGKKSICELVSSRLFYTIEMEPIGQFK